MKKLIGIIPFLLWSLTAVAQMPERTTLPVDYLDRITGEIVSGVDIGRFQSDEPNVIIVPDGTDDTVVCRYKSAAGNCYRLSVNDGKGHVPVVLIDNASFRNWEEAFSEREGWLMCEIIDNPWGEWSVVGSIPTEPGTHTYEEIRHCSTAGLANACPDTCPTESETRTITVTIEEPECVNTTWLPDVSTLPSTWMIAQTSNCGEVRQVMGGSDIPDTPTEPEPEPEPEPSCGEWLPPLPGDPSNYYTYEYIDQTNDCGETQRVHGTKDPNPTSPPPPTEPTCSNTGWSPDASNYYTDEAFTQYDSTGCDRPATGTLTRPEPPPVEPQNCTLYSADISYGYSVESDFAYVNNTDYAAYNAEVNGVLAYIDQMNMNIFGFNTSTSSVPCS